jgi:hypothetical protein
VFLKESYFDESFIKLKFGQFLNCMRSIFHDGKLFFLYFTTKIFLFGYVLLDSVFSLFDEYDSEKKINLDDSF